MKDAITSEDRLDAIDPKPIKYNWEFVLNKKWNQLLDWWNEDGAWPMCRRLLITGVMLSALFLTPLWLPSIIAWFK